MTAKFGVLEQTQGLTCHISSECVHCVGLWWVKPQFWANFYIWGLLYRPSFTNEGEICCAIADPRHTLTCQVLSRSVYSVAVWRRKTQNFAILWTSTFCGVTNWQQSEKVEHGCTTTNLPLSNGMRTVFCIGSWPSDHYFHSVCWFVCAEFFSAVFDPISIKLGHMLYVWV